MIEDSLPLLSFEYSRICSNRLKRRRRFVYTVSSHLGSIDSSATNTTRSTSASFRKHPRLRTQPRQLATTIKLPSLSRFSSRAQRKILRSWQRIEGFGDLRVVFDEDLIGGDRSVGGDGQIVPNSCYDKAHGCFKLAVG